MERRVECHNSRVRGITRHNGRNFDTAKADHIHDDRSKENVYIFNDDQDLQKEIINQETQLGRKLTFTEKVVATAEHFFGKQLEEQNERHIKSRHHKRVKTMSDWISQKDKRYKPQELKLQIGKKGEQQPGDREKLIQAEAKLRKILINDYEVVLASSAIHCDETVDHGHLDFWVPYWENGHMCIGNMEKALEQRGVPLPDPEKPANNIDNFRLKTFTADVRKIWIECCKEVGVEVIEEPSERSKESLSKKQYILMQEQAKVDRKIASISQQMASMDITAEELKLIEPIIAKMKQQEAILSNKEAFIEKHIQAETDRVFGQRSVITMGPTYVRKPEYIATIARQNAEKAWEAENKKSRSIENELQEAVKKHRHHSR